MPIIRDVAKRANVSIATVSNVLNNTSKVKDTTRARVLQAIADLGYETEISQKESRMRQVGTIGVILEDVIVFNTPDIYSGICETAQEAGYNVLTCNLGLVQAAKTLSFDEVAYLEPAQRAVNLLLSKDAQGIIYVGSQCREIKHASDGYGNKTPFVYAYCYANTENSASVIYDDEAATCELITYLIDKGHRNIGVIAGPENGAHVRLRLTGFQKALFNAGILYNPNYIFYGDWDNAEFGYKKAEELLRDGVSAIFCMNDTLAGGVIDYAHDHGIKLPDQLSLVGFDNIAASSAYYPKLTTVALPLMDIGRRAVTLMDHMLHGIMDSETEKIVSMPCRMVYRDSVAPFTKR